MFIPVPVLRAFIFIESFVELFCTTLLAEVVDPMIGFVIKLPVLFSECVSTFVTNLANGCVIVISVALFLAKDQPDVVNKLPPLGS